MPVRWRVLRNVRPKYSCPVCERIVHAPALVSAIARGNPVLSEVEGATLATLVHVVVSKFDCHLRLYHQNEMMVAPGGDIDRSTLAGWTGQAAALLPSVRRHGTARNLVSLHVRPDRPASNIPSGRVSRFTPGRCLCRL